MIIWALTTALVFASEPSLQLAQNRLAFDFDPCEHKRN
jgi:hypothetical protein